MKIAFLADALDQQYAGIHVYTKELLNALHRVDSKNEYIIIRSKEGQEFPGFKQIIIPINPKIPMHERWRQFIHFPLNLRKSGVDIVVEPGHFGPFNLPKSIKRVTVIHDLTPLLMPEFHIRNSQIAHKIFLPRILKKAKHIITNSKYTTSDVVKHYPFTKDKITSILLGKDPIYVPNNKPVVLEKYGIPPDFLLFVGTLEPRKNLPCLLNAFEKIMDQFPAISLVLVGKKGWRIESFMEKLNNSPAKTRLILPGYVLKEDLPVLYAHAKIFIYPSLYEGFGLPVLEAMSCGCPVITSKTSSLPEVGGNAALYIDPNSPDDLAATITEVLCNESLREDLAKKGIARAAEFSWEKAAKETIEVFESL